MSPPTCPLSIIVPVLDEAGGIEAQLTSLRPFRERGAEVLVVDGGSRDDTPRLAQALADRVIVSRRGRARQMNAGAALAGGEFLLFLHADTRLPPAADRAIGDAARAGARWGRFDVRIDTANPLLHLVATLMNLRSRWSGIATGDQAIFVRRDLFEAIEGFPVLPLMEDIAISKRLKAQAPPCCLRDRVSTSARRWEKHGVLRTILLMWRLRAAYFFGADPRQLATRYGYSPEQD